MRINGGCRLQEPMATVPGLKLLESFSQAASGVHVGKFVESFPIADGHLYAAAADGDAIAERFREKD
jgi:hypothetical protein